MSLYPPATAGAGIPIYNAAGTVQTGAHLVSDTANTGAGGSVTVTLAGAAAFTSATSYKVTNTAMGLLTNASVNIVQNSGSQFTIYTYNPANGAAYFNINVQYHAVGN